MVTNREVYSAHENAGSNNSVGDSSMAIAAMVCSSSLSVSQPAETSPCEGESDNNTPGDRLTISI